MVKLFLGDHRWAMIKPGSQPSKPLPFRYVTFGDAAVLPSPPGNIGDLDDTRDHNFAHEVDESGLRHDATSATPVAVPFTYDVHMILDNYTTHKTPQVRRWLARHPRFHVHYTPTYASWINLVRVGSPS